MDLKPPFWPEDYPALLELLGPDEFKRAVCPLDLARERYRGYLEGRREGYALLEAYVTIQLAQGTVIEEEAGEKLAKNFAGPKKGPLP